MNAISNYSRIRKYEKFAIIQLIKKALETKIMFFIWVKILQYMALMKG
jgi:hypothetical protein